MKLISILFLLAACTNPVVHSPPPIRDGKCVADQYVADTAMRQTCVYVGYSWACAWSAGVDTCDRKGEAAGERPVAVTK